MAAKRITHARALLLASKSASGEVSMAELRLVAEHMHRCPSCAAAAREMTEVYDILARAAKRARRHK